MSTLLGPTGEPAELWLYNQEEFAAKKGGRPPKPKPIIGDAFGDWSGLSRDFLHLPGGGVLGFDTSRLTFDDFRTMREHYQIGSSVNVLTFMLHQLDWKLEDGDKKVQDWCTYNLQLIWTRLVRALSTAFVFGYSANALEWENDQIEGKLRLNKIKDLVPDECEVKWRYVDSVLNEENIKAPKIPLFDGIRKRGTMHYIPVENSLWYPVFMENGNYQGRKLLKTAFQPWFFSSLIHLYQNKYFERFGEPVPVGRAPYNDKVKIGDQTVYGYDLMARMLKNLRNRSAAILPSSRSTEGINGTPEYDYQIEYLESQMRGADFERYLTRLDEEMSLALFTPLLLLRTADAGGFNQGIAHTQVYLWMLNAVAGDWSEYINKYILRPMAQFNFGASVKVPRIKFRKLGQSDGETLRGIIQTLIAKGAVKPDTEELGQHLGLQLEEIEQVTEPQDPNDPDFDPNDEDRIGRPNKLKNPDGVKPGSTTKQIQSRIADQVQRAYRLKRIDEWVPALGFRKQLTAELQSNGHPDPVEAVDTFNSMLITTLKDAAGLGEKTFPTSDEFLKYAGAVIDAEANKLYESVGA